MPELNELFNLESWVHFHPNILNAGRISHYINPALNEEVILNIFRIDKQSKIN